MRCLNVGIDCGCGSRGASASDSLDDQEGKVTDSESRPAAEAAIHRSGEQKHDVTQTFGHDSDLSFVPFGVELTEVEQSAIAALPPDPRCCWCAPARWRVHATSSTPT